MPRGIQAVPKLRRAGWGRSSPRILHGGRMHLLQRKKIHLERERRPVELEVEIGQRDPNDFPNVMAVQADHGAGLHTKMGARRRKGETSFLFEPTALTS